MLHSVSIIHYREQKKIDIMYLVPTAPGVYKHVIGIYIADEIVQSTES